MRRIPAPFEFVINAINQEQDFDPKAVSARRLVTMPNGGKAVVAFKPYWVQLRDTAYIIEQARAANLKKPSSQLPSEVTYRRAQTEFVRDLSDMVEKWRRSDWNLAACFQKHPDMAQRIDRFVRCRPLAFLAASGGPSLLINPLNPFGPFGLQHYPRGKDKPMVRARTDAITLFIRLTQHPAHVRLGRCVRCGRYFYGRVGQKCCPRPRRCGSTTAAIAVTKRRWKEARIEKLRRVRESCVEWMRQGPNQDWKEWVANQVGVTVKWITRAVNAGELEVPQRGKEIRT
jgi:hypothetical protein